MTDLHTTTARFAPKAKTGANFPTLGKSVTNSLIAQCIFVQMAELYIKEKRFEVEAHKRLRLASQPTELLKICYLTVQEQ